MLTPKQERFCQNLEVKKMSQRAAYRDAFPASKKWNDNSVDVKACTLANEDKIMLRREELRNEENAAIKEEAKWTREDAFNNLNWLIDKAKKEAEDKGEITSPIVSAITNSVKELNTIYAVMDKAGGKGVLEDILTAVRGISDD